MQPPGPLPTVADRSDAFDAWSVGGPDGAARFLASDTAATGSFSLLVTRPWNDTGGGTARLEQVVPVTSDAPVHLSLSARSDGSRPGAVLVRIRAGSDFTLALPGGTYGWTRFTLAGRVARGVSTAVVQIIAAAPTNGIRIDDVAVQGSGSSGVVVQNPGFEQNSADLTVTNPSLVFREHHAALDFATRRAPAGRLAWSLTDPSGAAAPQSGSTTIASGRATVMPQVGAGYWLLHATATFGTLTVDRTTPLVIIGAQVPGGAGLAFGVGLHLAGRPADATERLLTDLAAVGVRTVRLDAKWADVKTVRGKYGFSADLNADVAALQRHGMRPLLIVDYANPLYDGGHTPSSPTALAAYGRYAGALAAHYPSADFDVWNEFDFRQNDGRCGTAPACYLRLLHPAAAAIRGARTGARVVAPSIAGIGVNFDWLQGFLAGGGAAQADAIALHPYTQPAPPDGLAPDLDRLNAMVKAANRGAARPLWFTEIGWSTVPGWTTEDQQADFLARTMAIALGYGVQRVYWYDGVDDGRLPLDLESNFGLFAQPLSFAPLALVPKPAVAAEAVASARLAGATFESVDTHVPAGVSVYRFVRDGGEIRVIWSTGPTTRLTLQGSGLGVVATTGESLPAGGTSVGVDVTAGPVYVSGAVTSVTAR